MSATTGPARTGPGPAEDSDQIRHVLAAVRERGGRATSARRLLLEALTSAPGHQTADELTTAVQARMPEINKSTIYRNLDDLQRMGAIDRIYYRHCATYHLAARGHSHLVCERCGSITEIPGTTFASLAAALQDQYGFTIEPRKSAFIGTCARCQEAPVTT